ncbi:MULTISPECIES: DUF6318 family protein [unclassified Brachybacterium]|uniref:DUF6318 family protein n=1 Tax=unclassified Brachybacterium TaxID=2623841 RepID=UPI00361B2C72
MPRRLFSAAAAAALTLGLAACGDGSDGPVTSPPPDVTVTGGGSDGGGASDGGGSDGEGAPSDGGNSSDGGGNGEADPSAAAPDIPPPDPAEYAGMDEHTPEGAEQAFRYYIAVSMWAHQTGSDELLKTLQSDACEGCAYLNEDLKQIADGGHYWSEVEVTDIATAIHESPNFEHEIGYEFELGPHSRPSPDFSGRQNVTHLEYTAIGGMSWTSGEWTVSEMSIEWSENAHS